jgi:uncharacterized membrane protein
MSSRTLALITLFFVGAVIASYGLALLIGALYEHVPINQIFLVTGLANLLIGFAWYRYILGTDSGRKQMSVRSFAFLLLGISALTIYAVDYFQCRDNFNVWRSPVYVRNVILSNGLSNKCNFAFPTGMEMG